jgi:hypothetical protein
MVDPGDSRGKLDTANVTGKLMERPQLGQQQEEQTGPDYPLDKSRICSVTGPVSVR